MRSKHFNNFRLCALPSLYLSVLQVQSVWLTSFKEHCCLPKRTKPSLWNISQVKAMPVSSRPVREVGSGSKG